MRKMDAGKVALTHEGGSIASSFNRWLLGMIAGARVLLGQPRAALEAYRQVLAVDPTDERALMALGNLLAETGDLEEAVGAFRRLLECRPDTAEAWFNV